jgi:hypothetical protein
MMLNLCALLLPFLLLIFRPLDVVAAAPACAGVSLSGAAECAGFHWQCPFGFLLTFLSASFGGFISYNKRPVMECEYKLDEWRSM